MDVTMGRSWDRRSAAVGDSAEGKESELRDPRCSCSRCLRCSPGLAGSSAKLRVRESKAQAAGAPEPPPRGPVCVFSSLAAAFPGRQTRTGQIILEFQEESLLCGLKTGSPVLNAALLWTWYLGWVPTSLPLLAGGRLGERPLGSIIPRSRLLRGM